MDSIRLYLRYAGVSIRSQMQYRASFVLTALGQFLLTGIEFLAIWALFDRFGSLEAWRLEEVALLYGIASVSFAVSEALGRGFDRFGGQVKSGDFDRVMLRPRATAFQVAAAEIQLARVGRILQGAIVLGWAVVALDVDWNVARALLLLAAIAGGTCLFLGLLVLQATFSFWTTEGLEVANVLTYGGQEAMQFPLDIYQQWFRRFFTFIVPLACASYFPALAIMGHASPLGTPAWLGWVSPLVGPLFFGICLWIWNFGVRHYRSTGS